MCPNNVGKKDFLLTSTYISLNARCPGLVNYIMYVHTHRETNPRRTSTKVYMYDNDIAILSTP